MEVTQSYVELTRNELESYLRQMGECVTIRVPRPIDHTVGYHDYESMVATQMYNETNISFEEEYKVDIPKINWKAEIEATK